MVLSNRRGSSLRNPSLCYCVEYILLVPLLHPPLVLFIPFSAPVSFSYLSCRKLKPTLRRLVLYRRVFLLPIIPCSSCAASTKTTKRYRPCLNVKSFNRAPLLPIPPWPAPALCRRQRLVSVLEPPGPFPLYSSLGTADREGLRAIRLGTTVRPIPDTRRIPIRIIPSF